MGGVGVLEPPTAGGDGAEPPPKRRWKVVTDRVGKLFPFGQAVYVLFGASLAVVHAFHDFILSTTEHATFYDQSVWISSTTGLTPKTDIVDTMHDIRFDNPIYFPPSDGPSAIVNDRFSAPQSACGVYSIFVSVQIGENEDRTPQSPPEGHYQLVATKTSRPTQDQTSGRTVTTSVVLSEGRITTQGYLNLSGGALFEIFPTDTIRVQIKALHLDDKNIINSSLPLTGNKSGNLFQVIRTANCRNIREEGKTALQKLWDSIKAAVAAAPRI